MRQCSEGGRDQTLATWRTTGSCETIGQPSSEGDDAVVLLDKPGDIGRRRPRSTHTGQVIVGRPTGDRATLSDEDRDSMLQELRQQLPYRRDTHTFEPVRRLLGQQLSRVADKHNRRLVADLDRPVDRNVERYRSPRRVPSTRSGEVQRLHVSTPFVRDADRARRAHRSQSPIQGSTRTRTSSTTPSTPPP